MFFDIFVSCVFLFLFLFLYFNFSFDEELVFYSQVQLISVRRSCKKKIGNVTIRDATHDPSWNSEEKRNATEQNFALDAIRFHYLWMTLQVALNRSVVLAIDIPTCRAPLSWLCPDSALYPDVSGYCLKRQIWNSLWRPIYVINSLIILNYPVILSHRCSATVSLETWLLYKFKLLIEIREMVSFELGKEIKKDVFFRLVTSVGLFLQTLRYRHYWS